MKQRIISHPYSEAERNELIYSYLQLGPPSLLLYSLGPKPRVGGTHNGLDLLPTSINMIEAIPSDMPNLTKQAPIDILFPSDLDCVKLPTETNTKTETEEFPETQVPPGLVHNRKRESLFQTK